MNAKSRINTKSFLYRTFAICLVALLALAALPITPAYAVACTFTSAGTGNWSAAGTWTAAGGGCSTYPGQTFAGDTVIISSGNTVTLDVSPANAIGNLTINTQANGGGGGTNGLTVGANTLTAASISLTGSGTAGRFSTVSISTGTVNVTGNVTFAGTTAQARLTFTGAGTLTVAGTLGAAGTFTPSTGTVNFNAAGAQTIAAYTYNNLTLSGSGAKTTTGVTVNGVLSMGGTATASAAPTYGAAATLQYLGTASQTTGAEFPATFGGTGGVIINNANGVTLGAAKTITNGLTLTSGTLATGVNNLTLNGAVTCGGGSISATTSTVSYNQGAAGQNVCAGTYFNLTFSNSNKVLAPSGTIGIAGAFTPGTAVGHTITGSTVNFNGVGAQTIPAFNYNNLAISGAHTTNSVTLANAGTIGVAGTFTPSATFSTGAYVITNDTVNFNGTSVQTIPAFTFNNLTLSNTAGAGLSGNATINTTLALGANNLTTNANTAILASATGLTRTTGYVIGNLRKPVAAGAPTIVFEVGTGTSYAPISVTFTGATAGGTLVGSSTAGLHPQYATSNLSATKYVNRYWTLTPSGFTFTNYNVTFTYVNPGDLVGAPNTGALLVRSYNGSSWVAPVGSASVSPTATGTGFTTLGDFAVGESGLLSQTITFTSAAPVGATVGVGTYTPTATSTSGLPVTITVDPSASTVCSISAGVVSFIGAGTCVLDANQAGNGTYSPALQAQQSFTVSGVVVGTIYYVNNTNPSCSDTLNTGLTIPLPFCTIGKGAAVAVAGNTVRVLAGTYAETVALAHSGTSGNPITFSAAPGVIVTGNGTATGSAFRGFGFSYIVIDGFTINNTAEHGIYVTGSNFIFSNNHMTGVALNGIFALNANNVTISNNQFNTSGMSGILLSNTTASTVSGNTSDHNILDGIRLSASTNITVSNNITFANSDGLKGNGIALLAASNGNTVFHNVAYANRDTGLQVEGSSNNFLLGNLSYHNGDHGIDNTATSLNQTIIGNTIQGNHTSGINLELNSTGSTVANNILADNGQAPTGGRKPYNIYVDATSLAGTNINYNLYWMTSPYVRQIYWNNTGYNSLAAFKAAVPTQEVNGVEGDPLFIAPAAPVLVLPPAIVIGDYHIATGSPAIDSANSNATNEPTTDVAGNPRVDDPATVNTGTGVRTYDDRGAYEFQPGGTLPTVTTEAVTAIGATTATGNGTITGLGVPNPYEHGVVWGLAANPTIALATKTTDGAVSSTGAFTSAITGLTPGTLYHVRAYVTNTSGTSYGADVSFTVTSTTVGTSGSPSVYGSSVTFTATVLPATATGTVTFYDGVTVLGTGTLTAGTATLSTSTLSVSGSPHSITATYGGSGTVGPSTSSAISQTITPATLTYTANTASRVYGVANPAFTGTVTGFIAPDTQASATTGALTFTSTATATSNIGSYPITGSGLTANNGNYIFVQAAGNATALTITPATLTYTANPASRVYGAANPAFTGTVTGFVAPDTQATATTGALTFTSTATATSNIGSYPITGSGLTANNGNYIFVQAAGNATALTITPATLTYTANPASRVYGAIDPAFTGTVTGFVAPDTQASATTGALTFTSTATATSNVGSYAITGSGLTANNGNYTFVQAAGNATALTITPATLTYTANTASRAYGAANPAFTGTVTGFVAPDTQASATTGALTFTSTATATSNVGSYAITGSGLTANNGNYTFVQAASNATALTITPVALTITASSGTMTYGGTVPTITSSYSGLQAGDLAPATPPTCSTTATNTSPVGSYPSSCTGAVDPNYTITYTAGSVSVTPAPLMITASSGTMTYGGTVPTITPSYSGLQAGDIAPATPPTCSTTATNTSPVGSYSSSCAAAVDTNYNISYTAGSVNITPATTLTITASSGAMTYGGTVPTITPIYTGLQAGDLAPATLPTCSTTATNTSPVGSYPTSCTGAADANYNISYTAGSINITPAALTITASSDTMTYGGTVPTITPSYSGLQVGDIAPVTPPTCSTTATSASPVGSYSSSCAGAADANYTISYTAGSVTVTPEAGIVTLSNLAQTYDGTPKSATVVTTPLNLSVSVTYAGSATVPTNAGSYAVIATITDPNYSGSANDTLIISPATVDPVIKASNKVYDGTTTASFTCTLTGVIGLDSVNCTGGTATFADPNVGTSTVTATGLGLSGADLVNYQLSSTSATDTANITPRTLNVTATGVNKIYDGTTAATVTLADDRIGGDNVTTAYTTASFVDPNIGTGITVNVSGISITGGTKSGNYVLGNTTTTTAANITNASQIITVVTSAPSSASNASTFGVKATASSGLPVTITTSGSCSGGSTNGTATITMTSGSGTCSVFYNQDGVPNYAAASQVQEDVTASEGPVFTSADNTSFDVSIPGSFIITATGNPSTMTIGMSGVLPNGVNFTDNGDGTAKLDGTPAAGTNGIYNLVLTANNGVTPNATQNFKLTVKNGPVVTPNGVNSVPDTGNGSISENETILDTLGITHITVAFSQDVYNPANDTDVKDVTNPVNYLLVRSSSSVFQTVSCKAGPVAPDVTISVDSVTYSNGGGSGPFVSTLSINGGFPLNVVGYYRLYVCGTTSIVDAANNNLVLAGNGTTPGTDFQRNFIIASKIVTGGNNGGKNTSKAAAAINANGLLIPVTGFKPNVVTALPVQPADKAYKPLNNIRIEIPTLGINFPIVGVSFTNNNWDLTWLKNSVGYLEGSAYPTWSGNTVLSAHVIDANNNLGPFSDIKGMQLGQKIYIHFNRQVYVYQVQENQKILPTNISTVFKHEEDSWITLVTCEDYNAKTSLYDNRRMVRAVLISVIPEK